MDDSDVTPGWLSDVLGGEVRAISTQRIGDGLVGMNLRVSVDDADPALPGSVVIKLPSPDPTSRATGIALRNYEREVKFYEQIAATVAIRVPHCHFSTWDEATGDFVLVLEDMAPAEQGDQIAGCDVADAEAAVAELARLHGPRWGDPTLDSVDWLTRRNSDEDTAQLVALWQMFVDPFLATYGPALHSDQVDLVRAFGPRLAEWVDRREPPIAVTHGDYRLDNMLFGRSGDAPPVTTVDWQTPGHGSPVADLSYFVGAALVPDERRRTERALLDRYGQAVAEFGVDVDDGWLWEQYRRDAFGGVIMSVVASQIVGASDRSQDMFTAMATRHTQHALDLDSLDAI